MKKLLITALFCLFAFQVQAQDDRYPQQVNKEWSTKVKKQRIHYRTFIAAANSTIVGGRPAGCPNRFCACALSLKLFGRIVPDLNLAANWLKFPRVAPAPGKVAARRGHVFKLLAHVQGPVWQVWDANSGRGKIRIHNRSIAGYVIVDPRA